MISAAGSGGPACERHRAASYRLETSCVAASSHARGYGSYEEDGEKQAAMTGSGRSMQDPRAISGPLARVTKGKSRLPAGTRNGRSAPLAAVIAPLPKLIVRVRFSSPAPQTKGPGQAGNPGYGP